MTKPADDEEDRFQILATASLTLSGARVLKQGDTFAVFDRFGDIRPSGAFGAQGLYHDGARFLSALRLRLGGQPLPLLSSTVGADNMVFVVDMMNPELPPGGDVVVHHGTLHVAREKFLWQAACHERIHVTNYGPDAVELELELAFAADFADVFEVRGTRRDRRGAMHAPVLGDSSVELAYTGLDGLVRRTRLGFDPAPAVCAPDRALYRLHLPARVTQELHVTVACELGDDEPAACPRFAVAHARAAERLHELAARDCTIESSSEQFDDWIRRSLADLRMMITRTPAGLVPHAGVPWFCAPFGRDAIVTALAAMWVSPDLARGVLRFLAATQADRADPATDAEPGKIVHEIRGGEMATLGEIPFRRYYGSVDATPLFVVLAAAYHEHTGDGATIAELWPQVERALLWIERHGDCDGDGFVEYGRRAEHGLVHHGWKDSHDAVFHADGSPAEGPIALCEVQGYVYAAYQGGARLAELLGDEARARVLRARAERLRARFDAAFWCEELEGYALALDGGKRPCRVRTSNAGQCLFSGIALPERAPRLADRLLADDMFSGWGIRTVSACERRYNPMSYHNGSIWPHDNALIALGLARYNLKDHVLRVLQAMFEASGAAELSRLPELFCGFPRRDGAGPTMYPVACSPQAWAATAPLLLLQAALGMQVEGAEGRVLFLRSALPPALERVSIRNLRVGAGTIDLALHRHPEDVGIHILGRRGPVEIVAVK
ncbi:amylo-alpha-1,6-glucosidase [Nannocystis bainbridge]|uniref:Glycogen debranching N-terminal domain-containing protein n=1 Tax=Nannocystis bainbridge TaxID=2995303 RepID=A0ABT5DQI4_9BACT|nr:glycogen debranching N-terminal domain-containing protein [Nannocystis bainbridge]MDC0715806.1 glycogen debranching N-terminal domain-containing protein [Nannocystis bainbridge]